MIAERRRWQIQTASQGHVLVLKITPLVKKRIAGHAFSLAPTCAFCEDGRSMKVPFVKMHGCGNDFVVLDGLADTLPDLGTAAVTRALCDRRLGIGCDQLLVLQKPTRDDADYQMLIYNADASQVEMCGNGIRCLAVFLKNAGYVTTAKSRIQTLAGIIIPELMDNGEVRVDMGEPILEGRRVPVAHDGHVINMALPIDQVEQSLAITCVSMGNPHCIVYVDDLDRLDFSRLGPYLSVHPFFPKATNVEFVEVKNPRTVAVKVWERGAGATLACGTGACAVTVASVLNQKTDRSVAVMLPGGTLHIDWDAQTNHVFMTGPAVTVYEGVIAL